MAHFETIESLRSKGRYNEAINLFLSLPEKDRTSALIDISFIYFSKCDYTKSLTYLLAYLSKTKPTSLNDMASFLIKNLDIQIPNHPVLIKTKATYLNDYDFVDSLDAFKIQKFEVVHYPRLHFIFTGHCPHCNHEFEINTSMSFLVNFRSPCPKCFKSCEFNSVHIQDFFGTLDEKIAFNQRQVNQLAKASSYNFLDNMLNKHFSTCLSTVLLRSNKQ